MKRFLAVAVLSLFVFSGCASGPEFGEVSSAIQDSQEMQAENADSLAEDVESEASKEFDPEEQSGNLTLVELAHDYPEEWAAVLIDIAIGLDENSTDESYQVDLKQSPSTKPEDSQTVANKVRNATKIWGKFFASEVPLVVSVVHPNDKEWFLARWDSLGRDNSGEEWFGKSLGLGGGAAVAWNDQDEIPRMYFMFSDRFKPENLKADLFVHEATHFFQILAFGDSLGDQAGTCWIGEGSAEFVGLATKYLGNFESVEQDLYLNLKEYSRFRQSRGEGIMRRYQEDKNLTIAEGLSSDILRMKRSDSDCASPSGAMLGYNLGMLVTEKFLIDFDLQTLANFFIALDTYKLESAFEEATGQDYREWVQKTLIPYLEQEFGTKQ